MSRLDGLPMKRQIHLRDDRRARIADRAARLIVEDDLADFSLAKRKAARMLGLAEKNEEMPSDAMLEVALRKYHALFHNDEQTDRIANFRQKAVQIMSIVQRFRPYLTGSVLTGIAGRYAEIDIQLFADSAKEVELFLLKQGIAYEQQAPHIERAEAVFAVDVLGVPANLIVYPLQAERLVHKTRDGRIRERARLDVVQSLLADPWRAI